MGELGILKRCTGEGKLLRTEEHTVHRGLEFNPAFAAMLEGLGEISSV